MPSNYSSSLRLDLPTEGSYVDSWGDIVNDGVTKLIDTAVAGTATVTITSTNHVVSYANGATDEARASVLILSGTPGAAFNVFVPPVSKTYIVKNDVTTHTATIYCSSVAGNTTPAGTGIAIPSGKSVFIRTDGTNFTQAITGGLTSGTSLLYGDGSGGLSNVTIGSGISFSLGTLSATGSGTTTNVLTMNNGGSGAASGSTFDGSAARTISYNTIGAPSATGASASGTWSIGITGNAASATKLTTSNFTIEESGGKLLIKYGATTVLSISSAGALTSIDNVTAYGTP